MLIRWYPHVKNTEKSDPFQKIFHSVWFPNPLSNTQLVNSKYPKLMTINTKKTKWLLS